MAYQATIKLGLTKRGPLTHTGFKGRVMKKGESFTTTNPEEAAYYEAQPGFSVTVKGKGRAKPKDEEVELVEHDEAESSDEDESEEDERPAKVKGAYERADLKKLSRDDLLTLIREDDKLPLKVKELPKKAGRKEIVDAILEAQEGASDD